MSFQFSPDQHAAIDGVCDTLMGGDFESHELAVLTGSAGTGKTTVVSEIINKLKLRAIPPKVYLAASTHKASRVLQDIVGVDVVTGYSLFKLRPGINKYGKETLASSGKCEIFEGSVIIIDEASMIGNFFLKAIVDTIRDKFLKVLFVGDPFQLPPPKDSCSIFDGSLTTFTLTHVHRQTGGNPILEKANEYREYIEGIRKSEPVLETCLNAAGEGIHVLSHDDFVKEFVHKYVDYPVGADVDVPLCTFTNKSAIDYNNVVRKATYFLEDTIQPFYKGEQLIANSVILHAERVVITNNETVTVLEFSRGDLKGIPGHWVRVYGDYVEYLDSSEKTVFCPLSASSADSVLSKLRSKAIKEKTKAAWLDFYALKNQLADLRPPFAGTTHKSQGGTFSAIFIDRVNINQCKVPATKARLMYVALTRASKNVYINS
tara:strand:+ start:149 stop:1444 length:1296 start_codon:yes stop_codon:yes gene_type:complete